MEAEAGPSRWREISATPSLTNSYTVSLDDEVEDLADPEVFPQTPRSTCTDMPSQTSSIEDVLGYRNTSSVSLPPLIISASQNSALGHKPREIPSLLSILDHDLSYPPLPPLTRQTTYSSLPPSPRIGGIGYDARGLGIKELGDVLNRLEGHVNPDYQDERTARSDRVPPPRSRRGTTGEKDVQRESLPGFAGPPEETDDVKKGGASLWGLLKDEAGAEEWEGWVADGKW
jgi:hypothetical protein